MAQARVLPAHMKRGNDQRSRQPTPRQHPPSLPAQFEGDRNIQAYGSIRVLSYYDLEHVSKWAWLGWEALFVLAFACAAWAALALVRHPRR